LASYLPAGRQGSMDIYLSVDREYLPAGRQGSS